MFRTMAAVLAGKTARIAARVRGGGGSAMPGLVAEKVDPQFLANALRDVAGGIVVVSGTNGKTTTTKMLVALLRAHGVSVFTNPTGSNFTRGVISSMLSELPLTGRLTADMAVLELDEAHALHFTDVVRPTHALLLNVARDQLDRFAEIDHTARLLTTLGSRVSKGVVLNIDDSYINRIASEVQPGVSVRWFGLDASIADRLDELQEQDVRPVGDDTAPPVAGPADGFLKPADARSFGMVFGRDAAGGTVGPVTLQQRGLAAMINATAATTTARALLGDAFDATVVEEALAAVRPPFGRGETIDLGDSTLELVLVKNPAGFTVALSTYGDEQAATMIAINDDYADGRDVSWLYDVSFASLRGSGVAKTTGIRAWDMALRLDYDDVATTDVDTDLEQALWAFIDDHHGTPKRIFCTYTAMMALRRLLADKYDLPEFGHDPDATAAKVTS